MLGVYLADLVVAGGFERIRILWEQVLTIITTQKSHLLADIKYLALSNVHDESFRTQIRSSRVCPATPASLELETSMFEIQ